MILTLFQFPSMDNLIFFMITIITIFVLIFYFLEVLFLKIGLKVTKAPGKNNIKWAMISVLIQMGLMVFIAIPFVLIGFSGGFNVESTGSDPYGTSDQMSVIGPIIGGTLALLIFLWVNTINVLHRPGIKRSILIFLFMLIPIFIIVGIALGFSSFMMMMSYSGGTII